MSLYRFVYYSAVVAGWAAFAAWMAAEWLVLGGSRPGTREAALSGALVGSAISGGLNLVSGMTHAQWKRMIRRLAVGLAAGGIGGAVGGAIGNLLVQQELPQALGWMIMGLAIGGSEGFFEGSRTKRRNGLIGGGLGGLLGGWLFGQIAVGDADMAARACGFVVLGVSIGVLIGLTHVVLKQAWLTVVDGFRPGRELILSQPVTVLGRGDHLPLPLLGYAGRDLESEHAKITRTPDGRFSIEDNGSRLGTLLNGQPIQGPAPLSDGDLIKLGSNIVRFHLRHGASGRIAPAATDQPATATGSIAPPPPPPLKQYGGPARDAATPPAPSPSPTPSPTPTPPAGQATPPGTAPAEVPIAKPPGKSNSPAAHPRIPPPPPPPS